MTMRNLVLMAVTRPELSERAGASVPPGWTLIATRDENRAGASATRNRLLVEALASPKVGWLRFLDDDDEMLDAPVERWAAAFARRAHVVYFNARVVNGDRVTHTRYSGDPRADVFAKIGTWGFMARPSAYRRVFDRFGRHFPDAPSHLGTRLFADFLRVGCRIAFCPVAAYLYRADSAPDQITKSASYAAEWNDLLLELREDFSL